MAPAAPPAGSPSSPLTARRPPASSKSTTSSRRNSSAATTSSTPWPIWCLCVPTAMPWPTWALPRPAQSLNSGSSSPEPATWPGRRSHRRSSKPSGTPAASWSSTSWNRQTQTPVNPTFPSRLRLLPRGVRLRDHGGVVRIAIVAESFLPLMNGVTHSILRVLEHLQERGDEVLVIAPSTTDTDVLDVVHGAVVHRLPSVPLAGYANVRVALGGVYRVKRILADYAPDVVHLASPFVLGWRAAQAASQLGIPTVAIYQTEVPSYAARYGMPFMENWAWNRVENIHLLASRTLVPSTFALNQLRGRGIPRVDLWRRGVDTARFSPEKIGRASCRERLW